MVILGIGCDLLSINSIRRSLHRLGSDYVDYILSNDERIDSVNHPDLGRLLASSFAAKEACVKALGTGFSQGVELHDITVRQRNGKHSLHLSGAAAKVLRALQPLDHQSHLSLAISSSGDILQAFVIAQAFEKPCRESLR